MTVIGLLLTVLLSAGPPATVETPDELQVAVERLIEQLEAPQLKDRARAERELSDLGPKILRWLPAKDLLPGPASRDAVNRLRIQLQRRLATDSAKPSRVNLSGSYPLDELLTEITKQTGNATRLAEGIKTPLGAQHDWKFENATYWTAIDDICQSANLISRYPQNGIGIELALRHDEPAALAVCRAGVLRATIHAASERPITGQTENQLIRVEGELDFEPRLRPLFVHFLASNFTATIPEGKTLSAWNPGARYELPLTDAARHTPFRWDFVTPADAIPEDISVRGRLLVQLAAATEEIGFDIPLKQGEVLRRRGGVSVRLHETEFTDSDGDTQSARLRVTVSYDTGGPAFESHRTWVYHNAAWIEDGKQRLPLADFDALLATDGSIQLEYRFRDLPKDKPLRFVYEAPTLLLDVPFDLAFDKVTVRKQEIGE